MHNIIKLQLGIIGKWKWRRKEVCIDW